MFFHFLQPISTSSFRLRGGVFVIVIVIVIIVVHGHYLSDTRSIAYTYGTHAHEHARTHTHTHASAHLSLLTIARYTSLTSSVFVRSFVLIYCVHIFMHSNSLVLLIVAFIFASMCINYFFK